MIRQILTSFLFIIIVFIIFLGVRLGLNYIIDYVFFPLFDYFNRQNSLMKFFYLILTGGLFLVLYGFVKALFIFIATYVLYSFEANYFTTFGCAILSLIFSGISIYNLWEIMCCLNFWKTIQFLMMAGLVFSINHSIGGIHIIKMKEQND
jgi:hypothetical protein